MEVDWLRVPPEETITTDFDRFVSEGERGLRQSLTAALGPELGRDAVAEALAYAWEHWEKVRSMENPSGYLYRIGLNWGRRSRRQRPLSLPVAPSEPWVEPGLPDALSRLSEKQRVVVYLVHGHEWSLSEVAEHLGVSKGTVQTHMERGMARLRRQMKVET